MLCVGRHSDAGSGGKCRVGVNTAMQDTAGVVMEVVVDVIVGGGGVGGGGDFGGGGRGR